MVLQKMSNDQSKDHMYKALREYVNHTLYLQKMSKDQSKDHTYKSLREYVNHTLDLVFRFCFICYLKFVFLLYK